MLEGLVATLLNRFLGMYVKNFDPKQLQVGIWSGEVQLKNLELRREALDQLKLPVNVVEGHLGQLTMRIPLSNLRGSPVKINIEDVFLLAAPKEDAEYNDEEEKKRAHAVKMEKLENAELLKERNSEGLSQEEQQKSQSFTDSLVTAIVDNLQVVIKNIHLRYEDSISAPGHPFALGVTLKEFSAISTDENWTPTFIKGNAGTTHKLATLGSLALYWNTDTTLFGTGKGTDTGAEAQQVDHHELIEKFKDAIENGQGQQYILKPITGRAGVELDKTGKVEKPKVKARLLFNELGFILDDEQYRDALMLVDLFHYFIRHQEYKKYQPKSTPKEDPRAWLKFAGDAVLQKIQDRNRRWTWDFMKQRKEDRQKYIELFKKKKKGQTLTAPENEALTALEEKLTYEDLRFWRSLARNQLRKENVGVKKSEPKQTWSSWVWGGSKKQEQKSEQGEEDTTMTEEQRKQLYEAIDWDEKKAIADSVDQPRESIKLQIESSLRTGSFTLRRDPHGKKTEILSMMFDNFQAKALQRVDSMLADISLGGLRVYDGSTEDSLFPQIVKVKDTAVTSKTADAEETDEVVQSLDEEKPVEPEANESLFHIIVEQNPLDESADTSVFLTLKSIEVIYNPRFVVEVANFFKPPERHMESIGALMETAGATVEGIRQQTRAGLEFALEEHKTVNAQLDIQAPLIIVPESITQQSTLCLILDAGHVSLNSKLVDKDTMRDIQSKQKTKYGEEDYKQLEGLMYDKFLLKLDSTQVLIGPGIEVTKQQLVEGQEQKHYHIIDRINMDFVLETSIIPKASDLTKTRVSGHLPVLHASISDRKYKNLMRLIDVAIPKFDETSSNGPAEPSLEQQPGNDASKRDIQESRPRSKSILDVPKEEIVFDEDDDNKSESQSYVTTKSTATKSEEINLHQRNFEFRFTVEKLQGSLFRADPNEKEPDTLLVELNANQFNLNFYQRPFDMVAEVSLQSLNVDDHIERDPSPEFKRIVSSDGSDSDQGKELFNVKFVKVNPESPEFDSTYEGIATNLDVSVSTIDLVVTRRTLLTLLDFVLDTFTSPEPQQASKAIESGDAKKKQTPQTEDSPPSTDKIRIKANLKSIALILNNDGIRLATLGFHTADVGIFLTGGTMRVDARLGNLSLLDDINQGASEDSSLRQLISISGDELADFRYQTYDANGDSYPGYDSKVYLRSGSIKVNFLEEPFRKIIEFLVKFGKMQAIFNAARQAAANQASRVQESASKMNFDILVKTPIIVFPRVMATDRARDQLTAYLGEIYANNRFAKVKESKKDAVATKIATGVRNIRLTSNFHYDDDQSEELEMIEKVDLDFKITYIEHQEKIARPDVQVESTMSPVNLAITQTQLKFLLELSKSIPAAFATNPEETEQQVLEDLPKATTEPAKRVSDLGTQEDSESKPISNQAPELGSSPEVWTTLDLIFKAETVGLELIFAKPDEPIRDVEAASLSKFSINDTEVKLKMLSDGALESELQIHSFTITDSRSKETNKFRKIMSLVNDNVKQQFMASISMSGGNDKHLIAMVSVDSPRIIFALDYVFAVQSFVNTAFTADETLQVEESDEENLYDTGSVTSSSPDHTQAVEKDVSASSGGMSMSFRVNVEDAKVILIANPTISNSEAIVLGTKQILISQQNATTLQVTKVGMFLCRMDKFETSRLRILDDFTMNLSMENRSQGKKSSLTNIHIDIEPLVLRLSLRDILLVLQIVNKASESTSSSEDKKLEDQEPAKIKEIAGSNAKSPKKRTTVGRGSTIGGKKTGKSIAPSNKTTTVAQQAKSKSDVVMKREEMNAELQGIRVILIGDLHELPLIDWSVKKFEVGVRDWSGAMTADTSFDTYFNGYNFSKSASEPLIEPWQLGFHVARGQQPERMAGDIYSHKVMELTITSATIALASKSAQFLQTEEDVLSKPRGADAPYRIKNYTGFDLRVWAATHEEDQGNAAKLEDGEIAQWRFEDPTTMRENLSPEGSSGVVGVKLEGSGFESIERIAVNREGETLYNLKPRKDKVQHRLLVEVKLGADNVKYITFRSPLLVENNTQIPIEIGVYSPEEGHLLKIEKIQPGEGRPAPVGAAFFHSLVVRPDQGFGYTWSNERLFWKDLLKRSTRTITCKGESGDSPPFHFQMNASYDKNDPMTK